MLNLSELIENIGEIKCMQLNLDLKPCCCCCCLLWTQLREMEICVFCWKFKWKWACWRYQNHQKNVHNLWISLILTEVAINTQYICFAWTNERWLWRHNRMFLHFFCSRDILFLFFLYFAENNFGKHNKISWM